ncbi:uncharacterized protein LOC134828208 isoform X2 [Culicoides brevitarsis]|uniref:uncharacterized protein LOC134828208 isoform X2 n=1 Tax=Culicoides brevitarsis TaxID=469753 RepID=UPI00307C224D
MATRERKTRNITESPTSIGSAESITSTQKPSTPTKVGRGRIRGRGSIRSVQNNDDNESLQSNEDDSNGKQTTQRSSSRMSTGSVTKDENEDVSKQDDTKSSPGRQISRRTKAEAIAETFTKRIVRSNSDLLKRSPLLKRKSLPVVSRRGMGRKRGTARHSLGARTVKSVTESTDDKPTKKAGRRRKIDSDKTEDIFKKPAEVENVETESVSESDNQATIRRHRSASKSSDTTQSDIDMKTEELIDNVKKEHLDGDDFSKKQDILDKMAQNFSESKVSTDEASQTRRSSRPRKSTCKDKDDLVKQTDIKHESKIADLPEIAEFDKDQLEINTETIRESSEKPNDSSLSPQLISEGVSEISVKTFYGEPAFLENNLGIEKDPKLGEIVQVKSKLSSDMVEEQKEVSSMKLIDVSESTKASDNLKLETATAPESRDEASIELEAKTDYDNFEIANAPKDKSSDEIVEEDKENNKTDEIIKRSDLDQGSEEQKISNIEMEQQFNETPDLIKEKEKHLLSLGLLSHEAAVEAAKEKRKRREILQRNISKTDKRNKAPEYTGTLKTIIKLNRTSPEKRKTRMPLKMTFAKGRPPKQNTEKDTNGSAETIENTFYTIHQDKQAENQQEGQNSEKSRKGHNRFQTESNVVVENPECEKQLVVPEKASSFKVHPDRLCLDQCFYCGGKFGLYDTPCHIAQIKSIDRQEKILKSEEKLTRDSCLCDACFRHVDRKANCASYRKRLSANASHSNEGDNKTDHDESQNDSYEQGADKEITGNENKCCVSQCTESVSHSLRKKWLIKTKKQVSKVIEINENIVSSVVNFVPICDTHYQLINHLMVCAMCKRKLPKNHIFYIATDLSRLEYLIYNQGIPMKLGNTALMVCKLCRYYANLLLKPSDDRPQKETFIKNYNKRLLQLVNSENESKVTDEEAEKSDAKQTTKLREMRKLKKTLHNDAVSTDVTHEPEISIIPSKPHTSTAGHILLDNDVMVDYDNPLMESGVQRQAFAQKMHSSSMQKNLGLQTKERDMAKALKSNPNISMRELFPGEEEMNLHVNIPFNSSANRTPEGWARVFTTIQYDEATRNLWEELQKPYGNQSSFLKHLILLEKYYRNGDLVLSQNASSNAVTYSESVQNRLKSYDSPIGMQEDGSSLNILQQLSNAPITIIPTVKNKVKIGNADNLLKNQTNNFPIENTKRKLEKFGHKNKQGHTSQPPSKQMKVDDQQKASAPPDLISINQSQKGDTVPCSSSPQKKLSPNTTQQIIKLPDTLTPSERKQTAKPWRPTLIPITAGSTAALNSGPLYQTADGRKLPGLVQVMSGGKPYHISIHDYNRMCILRREKLWQIQKQQQQQLQQQENSTNSKPQKVSSPPIDTNKTKMVQIPNQLLEQNSLIPIASTNTAKFQNNSLSDTNGNKPKKSGNSLQKNPIPIAPKLPTSTSVMKLPVTTSSTEKQKQTNSTEAASFNIVPNNLGTQPLANSNPNTSMPSQINSGPTTPTSAIEALMKSQYQNQLWLWGESLHQGQMLGNSGGGIIVDNSLLSKIPKSLTVIPQQRNRNQGDTSSNSTDDNNPLNG